MTRCEACSEKWQERYEMACEHYQKALALATTVAIIAASMGLLAAVIAALCVIRTQKFIEGFEYVEETLIEQDGDGNNTAVIVDNGITRGRCN